MVEREHVDRELRAVHHHIVAQEIVEAVCNVIDVLVLLIALWLVASQMRGADDSCSLSTVSASLTVN